LLAAGKRASEGEREKGRVAMEEVSFALRERERERAPSRKKREMEKERERRRQAKKYENSEAKRREVFSIFVSSLSLFLEKERALFLNCAPLFGRFLPSRR